MKNLILFSLFSFLFSLSAFAMIPADPELNDIKGHHYEQAISALYSRQIVQGDDGKNTFRPDDGINRAEITKIVVEASEPTEAMSLYNTNCFPDVPKDQWYTKYICYAKAKGWVKGFTDGKFRPAQNVTNFEGMKIAAKSFDLQFTEGTPWYANLVDTLATDNLIPDTISKPNANLTRGEMSDLILRLLQFETSPTNLANYLISLDRQNLTVTLETIEAGLRVSDFEKQEICAAESC